MAAPTTQNEVTVRRLSGIITGVWDKCKNMFQTKLGISSSGDSSKFLNEKGEWVVPAGSSAGSIEEIGVTAVDLNNLTAIDSKVHYYTWSNSNRGNVSNKPSDAVYTVCVFVQGSGSLGTYVMQMAYKRGTSEIYVRRRSDGSTAWSSWEMLASSTGTYSQMTVGNATTASSAGKLTTARKTYVTLGTASTTTTRDWSGDTTIPVDGTLAISNGGTGAASVDGARENLALVGVNGRSFSNTDTAVKYFNFADIVCSLSYMNHPITLKLTGRATPSKHLTLYLQNLNGNTPGFTYRMVSLDVVDNTYTWDNYIEFGYTTETINGILTYHLWAKVGQYHTFSWSLENADSHSYSYITPKSVSQTTAPTAITMFVQEVATSMLFSSGTSAGVGGTTTPVYVDTKGRMQVCTPFSMTVGAAATASDAAAVGPYSAFASTAATYGFSRLGTVIFSSSSKKGLMTFRVHASRGINEVYVLHGEFGRNARGEVTSRFMTEGPSGPLYKLCYKDVSDSTNPKYEIWLVDTATTDSLERRARIELISVDISGFDRNFTSQQTDPGSLTDFWKSTIDAYIPAIADKGDSSGNNKVFAHWSGNNVTSVTPSSSQARTGTKWLVAGYTESDGTHFNIVDVNNVTVKNAQQINGYPVIVGQLGTATGTIYFV